LEAHPSRPERAPPDPWVRLYGKSLVSHGMIVAVIVKVAVDASIADVVRLACLMAAERAATGLRKRGPGQRQHVHVCTRQQQRLSSFAPLCCGTKAKQ
jgi:hypothetical protein